MLFRSIGNKAVSYTTPDNIVQIGENAFYMSELEEVICKGVENISTEGFRQSSKLKRIGGGHVTKSLASVSVHINLSCMRGKGWLLMV